VRDDPALEEPSVPGQDDPPLVPGDLRDRAVIQGIRIERIEPEEPQGFRELPQMNVEDEPCDTQRARSYLRNGRNVEAFENRIHTDPVGIRDPVREVLGPAIDENEIDLGMRHSELLDKGLHCRSFGEWGADFFLSRFFGEEIIELLVESDVNGIPAHDLSGNKSLFFLPKAIRIIIGPISLR